MSTVTSQNVFTLSKLFLSVRTSSAMKQIVQGLFTEREVAELTQRIEIVKLIKKGVPHHKIALTLGVGVATVTRGAKEVKLGRFKPL